MALSDYHLCAVCEGKAFYDADCGGKYLEMVDRGSVKALCGDCEKTHQLVVTPHYDQLLATLKCIHSAWHTGIIRSDSEHTLILEDGSRHTGPAVDFLARLAAAQIELIEATLSTVSPSGDL